jgi:hypothetical protein
MFSINPNGAVIPSLIEARKAEPADQTPLMKSVGQVAQDQSELDEGLDYFAVQGERDRERLIRG